MARIRASILFIVALTVAGLMPLSAGALGLGEIDLKSALNQPFRAEIPIASESPGDLGGLRVEIASADTFRQFGLDRAVFLSDFEFAVVDQAGGAAVLVSSQQPVVEPFVTLLLEVSWAQGRLLREYTVLLDPPVFATESVEPAVAAPTAGPSVSAPTPREEMVPTKSSGTAASQPTSMPPREKSVADSGGTYGPVQRNETLWGIARQYADSASVSRNQMMLAIYQANPEAFSGNINRLKAGMILRVPSSEEIALGSREATAEVRRQNEQWRGAPAPQVAQGGRLRLVPPPDRDTEAAEPTAPSARSDAARQSTAGSAETDVLQGRVSELESELAESRRQLQVRDSELEALQRQLADLARDRDAAPVIDGSELDAPELVPEFDAPEPDVGAADDADAPVAVDAEPAPEPDAVTEPAPLDVTPAPVARDDESFLGALFTNPLVYISLIIVVLLAWLVARNRSKTEEMGTGRWDALDAADDDDFDEEAHEATTRLRAQPPQDETFVVEEAPASEGTDEGSVAPFTDVSSEDWGGLVDEGETPLERTISTDSAVNLDQADPIAESDFHMAYGLYDQAAELLTRAVEIEPERKDLRLKLLEVYFIWENQDGFLKEARGLQEQIGGAANPDWNKVLIMGKQICPDEALFAGDASPVSSGDSVDLEFGEDGGVDTIDISLDEGSPSSVDLEFEEAGMDLDLDLTGDAGASGALDFDIGDEDEVTQIVGDHDIELSGDAPTMETPTVESRSIDDDGESTMETPTIESPAMDSTLETPTIESPAMESTMETPTIESPVGDWEDDAGLRSEQTAEINLDDLDLDLSGLDADSGAVDDDDDADAVGGSADFAADTLELDVQSEETQQRPAITLDDIPDDASALDELAEEDVDSTAEMRNLDVSESSDTVEQPAVSGDTAEQPNLASTQSDTILDIGEPIADDDPTAGLEEAVASGVEGATMTEVGTKLDLARAYIDMGDPDGARSILNEVLEEAKAEQRQEAQKLLDDLTD